jgi:hypothetical protein
MGDKYTLGMHSLIPLTLPLLVVTGTAICYTFVPPLAAQLPPTPPNGTVPFLFLSADPPEILADGFSSSTIEGSVWDGEDWYWSGPAVNFTTDLGFITPSARIMNGTATATLTAGTVPGVATIKAEVDLVDTGVVRNETTLRLTSAELDTGMGGYPSIPGVFEGYIVPNHTVIVKTIAIYPCAGTGGHLEAVAFYNATTEYELANASWDGYQGDYHSRTFTEQFRLEEKGEYKYRIKMCSYTLIVHNQTYTTQDGSVINCTSFTDVNGAVHHDWLPAFRLGP